MRFERVVASLSYSQPQTSSYCGSFSNSFLFLSSLQQSHATKYLNPTQNQIIPLQFKDIRSDLKKTVCFYTEYDLKRLKRERSKPHRRRIFEVNVITKSNQQFHKRFTYISLLHVVSISPKHYWKQNFLESSFFLSARIRWASIP